MHPDRPNTLGGSREMGSGSKQSGGKGKITKRVEAQKKTQFAGSWEITEERIIPQGLRD